MQKPDVSLIQQIRLLSIPIWLKATLTLLLSVMLLLSFAVGGYSLLKGADTSLKVTGSLLQSLFSIFALAMLLLCSENGTQCNDDFLRQPTDKLYFAQDFVFFLCSLLNKRPHLFTGAT